MHNRGGLHFTSVSQSCRSPVRRSRSLVECLLCILLYVDHVRSYEHLASLHRERAISSRTMGLGKEEILVFSCLVELHDLIDAF